MADTILTKHCSACKTEKPLDGFGKNRSRKDGLHNECRLCAARRTREWIHQPHVRERRRLKARVVRQLPEQIAYRKAYGQRPEVLKQSRERMNEYYYRNKDKAMARVYVYSAIQRGKIASPLTLKCHHCGKQAAEYHHESYAREDWLKVIPLCETCHDVLHSLRPLESAGTDSAA